MNVPKIDLKLYKGNKLEQWINKKMMLCFNHRIILKNDYTTNINPIIYNEYLFSMLLLNLPYAAYPYGRQPI